MSAGQVGARRAWRLPAALVSTTLAVLLTGCKEVKEAAVSGYQPAKVEAVGGLDVSQVTLTQEGANRVDLRTATAARSGQHTVVPYAALIYDSQGVPWVYTSRVPLTFRRTKVVVDRIEGNRVLLASGLRPGTRVVTVGAAEVYGAELDIAGGH